MTRPFGVVVTLVAIVSILFTVPSAEAAVVGGVVLTAQGDPVPAAVVTIQQTDAPRGQGYAARLQTDRTGRFIFDGIPGGRYVVVARTRVSEVSTRVALRENGAVRLRIVMPGRRNPAIGD